MASIQKERKLVQDTYHGASTFVLGSDGGRSSPPSLTLPWYRGVVQHNVLRSSRESIQVQVLKIVRPSASSLVVLYDSGDIGKSPFG